MPAAGATIYRSCGHGLSGLIYMQRINLSTRKKNLKAQTSKLPSGILAVAVVIVILAMGGHYLSLRHQYG